MKGFTQSLCPPYINSLVRFIYLPTPSPLILVHCDSADQFLNFICRIIVSIENTYIRLFILHFYDCFKVSLDVPSSIYCFKVQACFSQLVFIHKFKTNPQQTRYINCSCGQQEKAAILISRRLLRMRRMYVACMQPAFGLRSRMYGMRSKHFDHARLDLPSLVILSRVF